ncbi:MAG TPA: adenylate/guanylate cyclase domain-containing protein [Acidimicrobiales bacterium]|nr:adenylate/guanylate cyclase domain-containing protein [Acidimicrobiales bacterium]
MTGLPSGTTTFLFSDIEGSTRLVRELGADYDVLLAEHQGLLRQAWADHDGHEVGTEGDSFFVAFAMARDAARAALDGQKALSSHSWPEGVALRVRMGLHTGEARVVGDDYVGLAVHQAARISSVAHGGQIVCSRVTRDLIASELPDGVTFLDLGDHRLKDLPEPERLYQLCHQGLAADFPPLRSVDVRRHNLPVQLTTFVGRATELASLRELVESQRLVTLLGPGGTGKTRLAVEVASAVVRPDGVWFVDLAAIMEPNLVPQAFVAALGVDIEPDVASVTEHLRTKNTLLLVDNSEHLLDATARVVDQILRHCPDVSVLVTSREPLGISGEARWQVLPLSVKEPTDGMTMSELADCEAVQLFCARATMSDRSFAPVDADARPIAELCHRLDGIPLAVELAAARVGAMSVREIAARLEDSFALLVSGDRLALPRQRTLRALIEWSYDLLDQAERGLLRRASAFLGTFTVDGIEAVAGSIEDGADVLAGLVDKSLVVATREDGVTRYRLLDTIRRFANDRLVEAQEARAVQALLKEWCLSIVEAPLPPDGQARYLWRIATEYQTIRGVLALLVETGQADEAQRLAAGLSSYWGVSHMPYEGLDWLRKVIALPSAASENRAAALIPAATIARAWRYDSEALTYAEEAVNILRAVGERRALAFALRALAGVLASEYVGRYESARELAEECLHLADTDEKVFDLLPDVLGDLARLASSPAEAERLRHRQLDAARRYGKVAVIADVLRALAERAWRAGRLDDALGFFEELGVIVADADDIASLAVLNWRRALLLTESGDGVAARRLLDDAVAIAPTVADPFSRCSLLFHIGIAFAEIDPVRGRAVNEESLVIAREVNAGAGISGNLEALGHHAMRLGEFGLAQQQLEEALRLEQEFGGFADCAALFATLGHLALLQGEPAVAASRHGEALQLAVHHAGAQSLQPYVALALEGLAMAASEDGRHKAAARLFGAMAARDRELDLPRRRNGGVFMEFMKPVDWSERSVRAEAESRQALAPEDFEIAFAAGLATPIGDLLSIVDG